MVLLPILPWAVSSQDFPSHEFLSWKAPVSFHNSAVGKIYKRCRAVYQQRFGGLLGMNCHPLKPPCRRFRFLLSRGQHSHLMASSMTTPSAPRQRRPSRIAVLSLPVPSLSRSTPGHSRLILPALVCGRLAY